MGLRAFGIRKKVLKWAPLEKPWANICGKYCKFVARHPLPFIIFPVILTALLSTSILGHFNIVRGVHYLYAPLEAEWKTEEGVFRDNWAKSDSKFYPGKDFLLRKGIYLILEARDGKNVLRPEHSREFIAFLDWIRNSTFVSKDGIPYSYSEICLRFQNECFSNIQARFLAEIFTKGDQVHFHFLT